MKQLWNGPLNKIDDYRWEIPQGYHTGMRVPGLIYASSTLLEKITPGPGTGAGSQCCFLTGHCGLFFCYAGYSLGVRFPNRRSSCYFPG